jgi:tetratricopeptide (TPR) repeat protein
MPPFRQIGLAKAMTWVFNNQAFENGITRILWHCFESNLPSWRTALSAGFSLADRQEILMLYWDNSLNQAVHGNINFEQGDYEKALIWYEKALSQGEPHSWMAFNAACASAQLNQPNPAFKYLFLAIDLGFDNLDYLVANRHLESLKKDPKWGEIITQLNQSLQ